MQNLGELIFRLRFPAMGAEPGFPIYRIAAEAAFPDFFFCPAATGFLPATGRILTGTRLHLMKQYLLPPVK